MMRIKKMGPFALAGALILALLTAPSAPALAFKQIPATNWGHIYAGTEPTASLPLLVHLTHRFGIPLHLLMLWQEKI